jgi:hypothetical protein
MTFTLVLKNSMLLFLIILIIHFMVKNELLESYHRQQNQTQPVRKTPMKQEDSLRKDFEKKTVCEESVKIVDKPYAIDTRDTQDTQGIQENQFKELYDFVYENTEDSDTSLEKYFTSKIETPNTTNPEISAHHAEKISEQKDNDHFMCDYEVIGNIDSMDDMLAGLDMSCSQMFSKTI